MYDKVISIYCIVDDILQKIGHQEDIRISVSDAQILSTALIAGTFFYGHHQNALDYLSSHKIFSTHLEKSRFNRRLHRIAYLLFDISSYLGHTFKSLSADSVYIIDSFPVAICHNIRIGRCRILPKDEDYRGYNASKRVYVYGIKVHMIITSDGLPIEFCFLPASEHDLLGLQALPCNLPENSELHGDAAYTDYLLEEDAWEAMKIKLMVSRKKGSKKPAEHLGEKLYKSITRHYIETTFSKITYKMPKTIHSVTFNGFLIKIALFILAYTIGKMY